MYWAARGPAMAPHPSLNPRPHGAAQEHQDSTRSCVWGDALSGIPERETPARPIVLSYPPTTRRYTASVSSAV